MYILKNQFYSFKWESTYGTDIMPVFHFSVLREETELLNTKPNKTDQTKQKPQKALVGRKSGN